MTPYYQDSSVTLYHGRNEEVLPELENELVDACITSPPYDGLRVKDDCEETPLGWLCADCADYAADMMEDDEE